MSDYTPTTEWVITGWMKARASDGITADIAFEEINRWLAEVKAKEREDCVNHVKFLYCSHSMEYRPYQEAVDDIVEVLTGKEDGSDVFDKWFAEVKAQACSHTFTQQLEEHSLAELIRMAKADAWEECAQEAYDRGMLHDITFEDIQTLNPYRQGATE